MSKATPKKRRKKKKPEGVVETPFGAVVPNPPKMGTMLSTGQRKALDQLLVSGTDESRSGPLPSGPTQGRALPRNETKADHLLIKEICLTKNMQNGEWEVGHIDTNQGKFGTSQEQTDSINQKLIRSMVHYLKSIIEPSLEAFIDEEENEKD